MAQLTPVSSSSLASHCGDRARCHRPGRSVPRLDQRRRPAERARQGVRAHRFAEGRRHARDGRELTRSTRCRHRSIRPGGSIELLGHGLTVVLSDCLTRGRTGAADAKENARRGGIRVLCRHDRPARAVPLLGQRGRAVLADRCAGGCAGTADREENRGERVRRLLNGRRRPLRPVPLVGKGHSAGIADGDAEGAADTRHRSRVGGNARHRHRYVTPRRPVPELRRLHRDRWQQRPLRAHGHTERRADARVGRPVDGLARKHGRAAHQAPRRCRGSGRCQEHPREQTCGNDRETSKETTHH